MGKTSGTFTNKRAQKLHTVAHLPDSGEVKAVIFWHHGLGEYIDRFDDAFKSWNEKGIAVFGFDVHGMGLSEPLDEASRALIRKWQHLVEDAVQFYTEVLQPALKEKGITAPVFMAGNSMGGLAASHIVLEKPETFRGLILQSPAIDVEWTPMLRVQAAVGGLMAALTPKAKIVPAVKPEMMSQDPAVVESFIKDPLIYKGDVKALTGNELLKSFKALRARRPHVKLPIFAVHGTADKCTSLPALREHIQAVPSADKTLKEVEGGYHELLHGPEKADVKTWIAEWVLAHSGPEAVPEPPAEAAAPAAAAGGEAAAAPAEAKEGETKEGEMKEGETAAAAPKEAEAAPAAAKEEAPAAAKEEAPAAPKEEAPAAPKEEAPAAPKEEVPAAPKEEAPAAPKEEEKEAKEEPKEAEKDEPKAAEAKAEPAKEAKQEA